MILTAVGNPALAVANTLTPSMGIYVYPAKGQTTEQQSKDDYECFGWAKGQTGYDPMKPPSRMRTAPVSKAAVIL